MVAAIIFFAYFVGTFLSSSALAAPSQTPQLCNGYTSLCDRIYSNVTFIGTHDSAFVGPLPTENQDDSVATQLSKQVRFLQAQTHVKNNALEMCHTSCTELDAGSLISYLGNIKTFLDNNPNEVITLLLTNGDRAAPALFDSSFSAAGLKKYVFIPSTSPSVLPYDQWPTLGQMITAGTRLVVFLDYNANEAQVPYLLSEFNYYFETPFDTTDKNFAQCSIDRPSGANPAGRMYIVNHFLDFSLFGILIPNRASAGSTNAATGNPSSIGTQMSRCVGLYGRYPNVVLVDFEDKGNPIDAEKTADGLTKAKR